MLTLDEKPFAKFVANAILAHRGGRRNYHNLLDIRARMVMRIDNREQSTAPQSRTVLCLMVNHSTQGDGRRSSSEN